MQRKKIAVITILGLIVSAGCSTENKRTGIGAGIGAAAGAGLGAVIGHQSGNRGKGALIGAALGAGLGGVIGNRLDKQAKELEKIAETKRTEAGLVAKLKSDILFDTGKAELKPQAKKNLSEMATIMKKYPENVLTIKGYTDSTGSLTTNESLSRLRAEAVRSQLVANGIPANTATTIGMGPNEPIAENTTASGRSQNRRVEIEVTVDESKVPKES
jgi:outer membrane protein OmpA-like peptidoglycan-associated protein